MLYKKNSYKTVVFIPPNGILKRHDFSLDRIAIGLSKEKSINKVLLYIYSQKDESKINYFDQIIKVSNEEALYKELDKIEYDTIFSRSWMHAYPFSARLVKNFNNVIVNIKDWNFSSKDEYRFLFGNDDDFDAIEYIFKNAKLILSHYTHQQAAKWANEYAVDEKKFIFFPEYCINLNADVPKQRDRSKIVFAGAFSPTSTPKRFYVSKDMYESIFCITKQNIYLDYILPADFYDSLDKNQYKDYLYEDRFNKYFSILRGKGLDVRIIENYGYGIFSPIMNEERNKELFEYAIPSKFAFYLEANLPMIVNSKMKSLSSLVLKNGLGIVIANKDVHNLKNILCKVNYEEMIENIIRYKKEFSYKNNILEIFRCN